jgi:HEPN domain-containing protein
LKQPEKEAKRWLDQARDDLRFVRWVRKQGEFFDKGCFIAQQSAEKAIKACIYAKGARSVLGHSVAELLERLVKDHPLLEELREPARLLDRFYIPTRYPNGLPGGAPFENFGLADLKQAAEIAERIVNAAVSLVEGKAPSKKS